MIDTNRTDSYSNRVAPFDLNGCFMSTQLPIEPRRDFLIFAWSGARRWQPVFYEPAFARLLSRYLPRFPHNMGTKYSKIRENIASNQSFWVVDMHVFGYVIASFDDMFLNSPKIFQGASKNICCQVIWNANDQQNRSIQKHWNPKFKWLRTKKFMKVDLPNYQEKNEDLTQEEQKRRLKERGVTFARYPRLSQSSSSFWYILIK